MSTQISNGQVSLNNLASIIHNATQDTISASLPVDRARMEDLCVILEQPKYLEEITFTSPLNSNNGHLLENEISDTLIWFFGLATDLKRLERIVLPLEFWAGIPQMFQKMRRLPRLQSLALTRPTSYDYMSSPLRAELDKAVLKGIESLNWLQEVTLPAEMITGRLAEDLDRIFDASISSYDETTIRYYKIRRESDSD